MKQMCEQMTCSTGLRVVGRPQASPMHQGPMFGRIGRIEESSEMLENFIADVHVHVSNFNVHAHLVYTFYILYIQICVRWALL